MAIIRKKKYQAKRKSFPLTIFLSKIQACLGEVQQNSNLELSLI